MYGSVQTVHSWFRRFRTNFHLEDEERSGCPSTTDTEIIKVMVDENLRYTVRELTGILKIPRTIMHNNLTKIDYVNRFEVWVLHQLTKSHLLNRISMCDLLLQRNKKDPFLKRSVTETWILYENITRKQGQGIRLW